MNWVREERKDESVEDRSDDRELDTDATLSDVEAEVLIVKELEMVDSEIEENEENQIEQLGDHVNP